MEHAGLFEIVLGTDGGELAWWQKSVRAIAVFFAALVIFRAGNTRILGKSSAFDIVLGVVYGAVLSRAITGNSPFLPTLAAALVLVLKAVAAVAYRSDFGFGKLVKGKSVKLIVEVNRKQEVLRKHSIEKNDVEGVPAQVRQQR